MVYFGFWFFPLWIIIFIFLFIIFLFIFWLWAIFSCLTSRLTIPQKLFWIIIILIFNLIGALFYFIFSKSMGDKIMKSKEIKGKRLLRSKNNRMIAGVCAGIGDYLGVDPTVIRLVWVLFTFFSMGAGVLAYIIAWVIVPEGK
ncbi:MAG: PspC domain-containing protein [Nanoarchaeota archaeon]|nr:PspC domain-containing protein [Nanoarchaeota archaeon]